MHSGIVITYLFIFVFVKNANSITNFADVACGGLQNRLGRIVGGQDAQEGEFPWLVSLTRRGGHFCGGSLLTKSYVLTAGHCMCSGSSIIPSNQIKIILAQHDITKPSPRRYEIGVKFVNLHSDYTCSKVRNDIAILELEKEVVWSEFLSPVCLPTGVGEVGYGSYANVLATVAGWGWQNEDHQKGGRANVLQKANVNVLETETCRKWYKSQGKKTKIQDTQMCAGYENGGIDSCWADSGGPLMVKSGRNNQMVQVGVVSTGIGCARPFLPGLYTRVSEYIPWIKSVVT